MGNEVIKNKIIVLSGEPVSGKGTAVKNIIQKLKEQGYNDGQIHLESTGTEFRRYFNSIIDLISNLNNEIELKNISDREELKDFFNNEEYRKILSTSIANLIRKNTNVSNFSIEQANNDEDFREVRKVVDTLIDEGMAKKGNEINKEEHPNDIWIIDSRLAFHNIPEAFSVRLTTNANVAGERLFNDKTRGKEDSKYQTLEEAKKEREERRIGENSRYKERYGLDLKDEKNYDLIIDTSYSNQSDIADVILKCQDCYRKNEEFSKNWASPKIFLPLQSERTTLETGMSSYNFENLAKEIEKNGYYPKQNIETINVDGVNYIIEGHHRNFALGYLGKTLVPYKTIAKDDEIIPGYSNTARERAETIKMQYLTGHEWLIKDDNNDFSYKKIYPELYQKLKNKEEQSR